jgi:hypothetical protein
MKKFDFTTDEGIAAFFAETDRVAKIYTDKEKGGS